MPLIVVKDHGQRRAWASPLELWFKDCGQRRAWPSSHGIVVKDQGQHHRQPSPPRPLLCLASGDGSLWPKQGCVHAAPGTIMLFRAGTRRAAVEKAFCTRTLPSGAGASVIHMGRHRLVGFSTTQQHQGMHVTGRLTSGLCESNQAVQPWVWIPPEGTRSLPLQIITPWEYWGWFPCLTWVRFRFRIQKCL